MAAKKKRMTAAPRSVKILNLTYKVKFVEQTERDAAEAYGWCDFDNQTIVVCRSIPPEAIADTFLHECLHAIAHAMDITWRKEEQVARRMATGICTLWKQNRAAFEWWDSLNK